MGATEYTHQVGPNLQEEYQKLVVSARSEFGSDPYSGTIATSTGVHPLNMEPVTLQEAVALAEQMLNGYELQKGESARAIPLREGDLDSRTLRVELRIDAEQYAALSKDQSRETLERLVLPNIALQPDEIIANVTLARAENNELAVYPEWRITPTATKGATLTRYFVVDPRVGIPSWEQGYPTQSAARAAAVEYAEQYAQRACSGWQNPLTSLPQEVEYQVVSLTRRESGEPLVSVRRVVEGATLEVEVGVAPRPKQRLPISGWYLVGLAPS